jgi:hypothetical protein
MKCGLDETEYSKDRPERNETIKKSLLRRPKPDRNRLAFREGESK